MDFSTFAIARLGEKKIADLSRGLDKLVAGRLWVKILIALVVGSGVGFLIGPEAALIPEKWSNTLGAWLALPGQIFLGLVQLVVIPLVFASVVLGIASGENVKQLQTLGLRAGVFYLLTTIVATTIGLSVAFIIKPGSYIDKEAIKKFMPESASIATSTEAISRPPITELIPQLLPDNPFSTLVSGQMLQIVLLAMFVGVALMALKEEDAKPLLDILKSFQKISMVVIGWAMKLAPIAVFGLMAKLLSQIGFNAMGGLGIYILTVILGLVLMIIFYLLIVAFWAKRNPFTFLSKIREVQLLAFSTSSSASVMPLTLKTAETKLGVSSSTSQFVIPLGTTINMDGTALYQGVATVFMAQVFGIDLSLSQLVLVVVTATMASIGAPGTPGVGIAILSMILTSVGIPASGIVLILGVDRILDMCRTVVNVTGDLTAALVLDKKD